MKDENKQITKFLKGDKVTLNAKEEEILSRWRDVDVMMRLGKSEKEIKDAIIAKYNVSSFTAQNDFYSAQSIFSEISKLDKGYLLGLHIEQMRMDVINYRESIYFCDVEDEEGKVIGRVAAKPSEKEINALSKLAEAYVYALNSMPSKKESRNTKAPMLVFTPISGRAIIKPMSTEEALAKADQYIQEAEVVKTNVNGSVQ
jgi:hypothetical protein